MKYIVLCFPNKEDLRAFMCKRCVGPFPDLEAVLQWTEANNENHYNAIPLEEPK